MKYSSAITLMFILLLAACGPASTPGQASGATQVALATDTVVVPQTTPTTPPKQAGPSAVASPSPPSTPAPPNATGTATPQLPPNWQTVEWEGLIIPVPPDFTWKPNPTGVRLFADVPVLASGGLAPNLPADQPVIEYPSGPGFYIMQFKGSLEDWLAEEIRAVNALPDVTPITTLWARDTTIAGRPAKAYPPQVGALGRGYETYALRLDSQRLLLITTADATNETYRRVIEGLVITPTVSAQLAPGWQTVEWQGLIIPVPPEGTWGATTDRQQLPPINGIPVLATGGINLPPPPDATLEVLNGPTFSILSFSGSLNEWLALERRNSPPENPIEKDTVRDVVIAGHPAKVYQYT